MLSVVADVAIFFFGILGMGAIGLRLRTRNSLVAALLLGQILIYLAWIVTLDVHVCFEILKVVSVFGLWALFTSGQALSSIFLFTFFGALFLSQPIINWDERFVWAFNAKVLHQFSGADIFAQFVRPELWITHPENPKLYSSLAAIVSSQRPWGATFPKLPMIAFWLPIYLLISQFQIPKIKKVFLYLLALTCCGPYVLTAYLDPVLAMSILVGAWALFCEPRLKREGLLLLSLSPLLKTEGVLFLGLLLVFYAYRAIRDRVWKVEIRQIAWLVPAGIGFILWKWRCSEFGLGSYYTASTNPFLTNFLTRASQPSLYWVVLRSMIQSNRILFDLLLVVGAYRWLSPLPLTRQVRDLLKVGAIYIGLLYVIYFGTPFDMVWHIGSSIDRTMLPFYLLTFGALVLEGRSQSRWT